MTVRSRLGGVDRETLMRGWFLLFLWLMVNFARAGFSPQPAWLQEAWLFGTGLTIFLIHRRHRFAGLVGFLVVGSLAGFTVLRCLAGLRWVHAVPHSTDINFAFSGLILHARGYAAFVILQALVPVAVLVSHLTSRHRLMLYEPAADIDVETDPRRRPGGYYFVTTR
jgi:hypothetical protein